MKKEELRIVFMGTPEFAVGTLRSLVENGYNVVCVVTQPDKPVGRHQDTLQPPAVKVYAAKHNIPVLQPERMKDETFIKELISYKPDLQVVVAFRMLPEVVWTLPRFGTFNVHAALLPQYRGAAPINWAIINGEKVTGVTTFFLDHDIDTGRIIMQREAEIGPEDNVETVYDRLMTLGAETAIDTIDKIIEGNGSVESMPQEQFVVNIGELSSAPKLFKDNCIIDWSKTSQQVHDFIRGLSPVPGAWATFADGGKQTIKIYDSRTTGISTDRAAGTFFVHDGRLMVSAGGEMLELLQVQLSGKKRMSAKDFVNGMRANLAG
ncbi:MAG: methionyl-tRNA formyltransferase [Prevotella sp.]|uniref:methionyl-tRNA formyltransferase n=1 Tax=Prevotella sp. TaxID=59823 RepID=UPI002A2A1528|nr:methionyl-tRNA formyltransferase [Prevotella sp.]MDD7318181.1 methionyl-tRNA formyltransferase [Prevotellaceae bacterium]MDY4020930.1 methionyl-tRNA formyltransferase [Prevotella sp.]